MRFLLDHNFSPKHAEMLRLYGFPVFSLRDEYPNKIRDVDWLSELAGADWIVVTCDQHIQTRKAEARALQASGVSAVFINPFFANLLLIKKGEGLLRHWQKIMAWAEESPAQSYCQVGRTAGSRTSGFEARLHPPRYPMSSNFIPS